jgi:hypothetical protein
MKRGTLAQLGVTLALGAWTSPARADPSKLPPPVGYNYGQIETARDEGMGGALRAFSNSTDALFLNPANMAATRVYHLGALAQIWPEADRQTYGIGIVDSIVSASHLAGGVGATWSRQDPDGVDRTFFDVRFALAYPLSDHFFVGATARYLSLKEGGFPRGLYDLHPSQAAGGASGQAIVQDLTFDAGITVKPVDEFAISLVGQNLTDPGIGFLPLMLGGGVAYGTDDFTVEADVLGDFTSYSETKMRAMFGGEYLLGGHFPLRAGYRYDQGADSHAISFGTGYVDSAYSIEFGLRHVVSGDGATVITIGFQYHVESSGMAPAESDF